MKYGNETEKYFLIKLSEEENYLAKNFIKDLNMSRREFLLISIENYVYKQNKDKSRLLRKKLRAYTKATQRLGKRRVSYLLRQVCGEVGTKQVESNESED